MSPLTVTVIIVIVLLAASAVLISSQNKKNKIVYKKEFMKRFGRRATSGLSLDARRAVCEYSKDRQDSFYRIDDITWNDLGMDELFDSMNCAASSPGEDVLYYLLRSITDDIEELKLRKAEADHFLENDEAASEVSYILSGIGRRKNTSVYHRIKTVENAEMLKMGKYVFLSIAAIVDIILFFIHPVAAVIGLIIVAAADTGIYLSERNSGVTCINAISDINLIYRTSVKLLKSGMLTDYMKNRLEDAVSKLDAFGRSSSFLLAGTKGDSGIPGALLKLVATFFHIDMFSYNRVIKTLKDNKDACVSLFYCAGLIDASVCVASFLKSLQTYSVPEFSGDKCGIETSGIYHPMIENAVANDITASGGNLITGSNASGKSTFLKTIGISAILAQSIYAVPASYMRLPFARVMSSMSVSDDLENNESYFTAELRSVKRICDAAEDGSFVICMIDEVLRGTNTIERIATSSSLLGSLIKDNVLCFAATHDRELTVILEKEFRNLHFEEKIEGNEVIFDYRIKDGPAGSRNAILLMERIGFDKEVVENSRRKVDAFEKNGRWV